MDRWIVSLLVWLPLFVLVIPPAAHAEIYKWVDAQGRIHYSDSPIGDAAPVDEILPPASIFTLPPEAMPPVVKSTEPAPGTTVSPSPSVATPPAEEEFTDDEPPADSDPTAPDNQPNLLDTPGDLPEEESAAPPSVTADAPDVPLLPEAAPEDQFGPGNEFDSEATGEASGE